MQNELITIIIPVYQVSCWLNECMRSVTAQEYANLEIILVDDGSTDGSAEICDQWADLDDRIRVIHQENRGLSAARNAGLDYATGAYVMFVDSDDIIAPDYAKKLHDAIIAMGVPCVVCGYSTFGGDGSSIVRRPTEGPCVISARECFERVLVPRADGVGGVPVTAWSKIYSLQLLKDAHIRFPEGEVYEDVSTMFPIVHASEQVGLIEDVLYFKRTREGSIIETLSARNIRDRETAQGRFANSVKAHYPELTDEADHWVELGDIACWAMWSKLEGDSGSDEVREGIRDARRRAVKSRSALKLPQDWRHLLKAWLLLAPGLFPAAQKVWRAVSCRGQLKKNALRYAVMTAANYFLSFLIVFYSARVLAAEALGNASFASTVIGYFALLAQMGIPLYGMRLCARTRGDPYELSRSTAELFVLRAVLTLVSVALLAVAVVLVPQFSAIAPLMAIFGVNLLVQLISFDWAFKGLEEYRYLLVRSIVVKTVQLALVILLVHSEGDLYLYAAIAVLSSAASGVADCVRLGKFVSLRRIRKLDWRQHVRPAATFFLMSCATLIYANLDIVMLGFMMDAAEVGYYEIAVKVKVALTAVGGIIWNVTLPKATQLWSQGDREGFERLAQRSLRFVCLLQLGTTALFMALAGWVIPLIAGEGYLPAVPAFRVLLFTLLPIGASNIIGGQVLIPAGKEKRLLAAELAGAGLNLVLNLALIPVYGIEGAAAATVAAECIVALVAYWYARKELQVVLFPWDRHLAGAARRMVSFARKARYRVDSMLISDETATCYCPCCDTKLRKWAVARFLQRPDLYDQRRYLDMPQDVVCPVCGSIPRHRIIAWHLGQRPDLVEGKQVLHFAPERSLTLWFARRGVSVMTADLFAEADLKLDLMDIDLPDCTYDVVVCNHVLEHVDDWRRALFELCRVLCPGGLLIISFPVDPRLETVHEDASVTDAPDRIEYFGQHDHLRVFGADSAELLADAGFRVEVVRGVDCPDRIRPVVGPADYDSTDIYLCWKLHE